MKRPANESLVACGLAEITLGALTGWPYAQAIADRDKARALGIQSTPRLRQWHLDLVALGGLSVLAGTAVPDMPRPVAWAIGVGGWTNANAFGVLVFRPDLHEHPGYRAAVGASFVMVTAGWTMLTAHALRRRPRRRRRWR